jgi:hypothetical protein
MAPIRSHFFGNLEVMPNGWLFCIEADKPAETWVRVFVGKKDDEEIILELQYILENIRDFIEGITEAASGNSDTDGIYIGGKD